MKLRVILLICSFLLPLEIAGAFEFYSTNKSHTYDLANFSEQISKQYGNKFSMFVVLIASKSDKNPNYNSQLKQLNSVDAESLSLVYVTATINKENIHGYHLSKESAETILSNNPYLVAIYSPAGKLLRKETSVLNADIIVSTVNEYNKSLSQTGAHDAPPG